MFMENMSKLMTSSIKYYLNICYQKYFLNISLSRTFNFWQS